jgi:isopenicillin N synthase-like dioxygenase
MIIYSPPKAASHLPVIDVADGASPDPLRRRAVAEKIRIAARDTGFFYVANHGVDAAVVRRAFEEAGRFFDQPAEQKMRLAKKAGSRGYEPEETQRLDNASPGDLKESFNFAGTSGNQWPADLPGFREGLEAYYAPVLDLGLRLMRLVALSLDMPESFFDAALQRPNAPLRILRYRPHPEGAEFNQLGAGAHTDWGAITILAQDDCGGLEVENASGEWVKAEPIPGTFVVNLGDLMSRWTNERYHSSLHRVMNNVSGRNRHSIVLFYNPEYDTLVECLPTCLAPGEQPKYAPCTAGEHSAQRYRESRAHLVDANGVIPSDVEGQRAI